MTREEAIDVFKHNYPSACFTDLCEAVETAIQVLSAQPEPEEDCDTCKHGYFGDSQCNNCRVRYPSHYEREEEQHEG